ncbi:outer membrane lipoprotein-sorting protein [Myxococcota bacterium]|nr:outer membrane lipoprotein-sorting protein [Myxococcota bacterium]
MRLRSFALALAAALPLPVQAQTPAPASGSTARAETPLPPAGPLDAAQMNTLLTIIDDRQRNSGDFKARAFIEQREKDKNDVFFETVFYRRDGSDQFLILFLKPKTEAGKGYLRIDKNLWMYDPATGKWERRTERERIGGTNSRSDDFDPIYLARDFTAVYVGSEKLGNFGVHHMKLTAKPGAKVADPIIELWVDQATGNILKQQGYALSGRLLRTAYYPKWEKVFSASKGADVYTPKEIRIFDEVEKENRTTVLIEQVDLAALDKNVFTKAWLESKSR